MYNKDFLQNVKVGDTVLYDSGTGFVTPMPVQVVGVTKTQITIKYDHGSNEKFNRSTGYKVGKTKMDEIALKNKRKELLHKLSYTVAMRNHLNKLNLEQLNKLESTLKDFLMLFNTKTL